MTQEKQPERLDFGFPVGTEGLTGRDLILTLVREFTKHGFAIAAIVVDVNAQEHAEFIGHGTEELIRQMFEKGVRMLEKGKVRAKDVFPSSSGQN